MCAVQFLSWCYRVRQLKDAEAHTAQRWHISARQAGESQAEMDCHDHGLNLPCSAESEVSVSNFGSRGNHP